MSAPTAARFRRGQQVALARDLAPDCQAGTICIIRRAWAGAPARYELAVGSWTFVAAEDDLAAVQLEFVFDLAPASKPPSPAGVE